MVFWNNEKLQIVIESANLGELVNYQLAMIQLIRAIGSEKAIPIHDLPAQLYYACEILESMVLDQDDLTEIQDKIRHKRTPLEIQVANLEKELATLKAKLHGKRDHLFAEKE